MCRLILLIAASIGALPGRAQLASASLQTVTTARARTENPGSAVAEPEVFSYAEQMPVFTGGETALRQFLAAHLTYPSGAFKAGQSGKVVVQFVVDEQGRTRDVEVVRTSDPEFDAAAKYAVLLMPWWIPGREHGQPVRVRCTLPIIFTFRRNP